MAEKSNSEIMECSNQKFDQSISTADTILKIDIEVLGNEVICLDSTKSRHSRSFSAPVSSKNTSQICLSECPASDSSGNLDQEVILPSFPMSPDFTRSKLMHCDPLSPGSMETPLQHGPKDLRKEAGSDSVPDRDNFVQDTKKRKAQRPLIELCTSDQVFSGCIKKVRVQLDPASLESEDCNAVIEEVIKSQPTWL